MSRIPTTPPHDAPSRARRGRPPRAAAAALAAALLASGCVERHLLVRTEPSGAAVRVSGQPVGEGPVAHRFSFYGTVRVEASLPGYEPAVETVTLALPWYQWFPIDFVADNLLPWTIRDGHEVLLRLKPLPEWSEEDTARARAEAERVRGRAERARLSSGAFDEEEDAGTPPDGGDGGRRP